MQIKGCIGFTKDKLKKEVEKIKQAKRRQNENQKIRINRRTKNQKKKKQRRKLQTNKEKILAACERMSVFFP